MGGAFARAVADIFYPWPVACSACGARNRTDGMLCAECTSVLNEETCRVGFAGIPGVFKSVAPHAYEGPAGEMVRGLKYYGIRAVGEAMARDMLAAAEICGMKKSDIVTHVPMHWTRRRLKSYDQSEVLAGAVAGYLRIRAVSALSRTRACRQQARMTTPEDRLRNVSGAFRADRRVRGKKVLLVDDVFTTGATASECVRALYEAGAAEVSLLVYARAGGG